MHAVSSGDVRNLVRERGSEVLNTAHACVFPHDLFLQPFRKRVNSFLPLHYLGRARVRFLAPYFIIRHSKDGLEQVSEDHPHKQLQLIARA